MCRQCLARAPFARSDLSRVKLERAPLWWSADITVLIGVECNDCAPYVTIGDRISLMTTSYAVAMNPMQNDVLCRPLLVDLLH
jgi:hypothetical protein